MTNNLKAEHGFFDSVVTILATECSRFHYPRDKCWKGECSVYEWGTGESEGSTEIPNAPSALLCNWKIILGLTIAFYRNGPGVNDNWKRAAEAAGFGSNGNQLHEIMLGVFVGGDGGHPERHWYETHGDKSVRFTDDAIQAALSFCFPARFQTPQPKGDLPTGHHWRASPTTPCP